MTVIESVDIHRDNDVVDVQNHFALHKSQPDTPAWQFAFFILKMLGAWFRLVITILSHVVVLLVMNINAKKYIYKI